MEEKPRKHKLVVADSSDEEATSTIPHRSKKLKREDELKEDVQESEENDESQDEEEEDVPAQRRPTKRSPSKKKDPAPKKKEDKDENEEKRKKSQSKADKDKQEQEEFDGNVAQIIKTMERAFSKDNQHRRENKPALEKLMAFEEIKPLLIQRNMYFQEKLIDEQFGRCVVNWLKPSRTTGLANVALRTQLFKIVKGLPFPGEDGQYLHGLGRMLNFHRNHPDETLENKRLLNEILTKWMEAMDLTAKTG